MTIEQEYIESELYKEHIVMLDARRDEIIRLNKEIEHLKSNIKKKTQKNNYRK